MSDIAGWKVHGPVETLSSELPTWDPDQDDWQPRERSTLATFRPDETIGTLDSHNPDGSVAHSRWLYDDAGRLAEINSWMNDELIDKTVYFYDEAGRHIRTVPLSYDGTQTDLEVCSYSADGHCELSRSREGGFS